MSNLIEAMRLHMTRKQLRKTPFVEAPGMFNTKMFYEKQGDL